MKFKGISVNTCVHEFFSLEKKICVFLLIMRTVLSIYYLYAFSYWSFLPSQCTSAHSTLPEIRNWRKRRLMFNTRDKQMASIPKGNWLCLSSRSTAVCTKSCTPQSTIPWGTLRRMHKMQRRLKNKEKRSFWRFLQEFHLRVDWELCDERKDAVAHPYKISKKLPPQNHWQTYHIKI